MRDEETRCEHEREAGNQPDGLAVHEPDPKERRCDEARGEPDRNVARRWRKAALAAARDHADPDVGGEEQSIGGHKEAVPDVRIWRRLGKKRRIGRNA